MTVAKPWALAGLLLAAGALLAIGCSGLPSSDGDDAKETASATGTGAGDAGCTAEARIVCVQTAPGRYEERGVGRSGPSCEFDMPPDAVADELCRPAATVACPEDARVVCVETAPGTYERRGVGRAGPSCEFPKLPGEVADDKCDGYTSDTMACKELEAKVELQLEALRTCDVDADCKVIDGACPFGCYHLVNAKASTQKLEDAAKAFAAACPVCDYECTPGPQDSDLRCVARRCVRPD
jgi:hypothetical protein